MAETIRNFKQNLAEPWEVFAGMTPYLESSRRESVLDKTIYFPYGAIEGEPAFPATNTSLEPVREVLDKKAEYPPLGSLMGITRSCCCSFRAPITSLPAHGFFEQETKRRRHTAGCLRTDLS